jgi:GH24 family phage-related lysozyme (muramidase)
MHPDVRESFRSFTTRFEGHLDFMYLDVEGLVTIGCGNLIDPKTVALGLPFVLKSDPSVAATPAQIDAEWSLVKSRGDMKLRGGGAYGAITTLVITESTLGDLLASKLSAFERVLEQVFPELESWPADAQLGLFSMAWAMGAGFTATWPHFKQACLAGDFASAAANCKMNDAGNPGLKPRNVANAVLFQNAARVVAAGLPRESLHYPRDLASERGQAATNA